MGIEIDTERAQTEPTHTMVIWDEISQEAHRHDAIIPEGSTAREIERAQADGLGDGPDDEEGWEIRDDRTEPDSGIRMIIIQSDRGHLGTIQLIPTGIQRG